MTHDVFNRETLLDTLVNVIPLGILAFFLVLFAVSNPFGSSGVERIVQFLLVGTPFVLLVGLTYLVAQRI